MGICIRTVCGSHTVSCTFLVNLHSKVSTVRSVSICFLIFRTHCVFRQNRHGRIWYRFHDLPVIPVKSGSYSKHSQDKTGCGSIRKNRGMRGFWFFLWHFLCFLCFFISDDPTERGNCFILYLFGNFRDQILIFFNHVLLHKRIFFVINVISPLFCQKSVLIAEKCILPFDRFHQHQDFFPAKVAQMNFCKQFIHIQIHLRSGKEPAGYFLSRKEFFLIYLYLCPYFFRKINVIRGSLHVFHHKCATHEQISNPIIPLRFTGEDSYTSLLRPVFCSCKPSQKRVHIILNIDPEIASCKSDLPYISR